jgi:hypothetical protein
MSDSDPVRHHGPEYGSTGGGGRPRSFPSGPLACNDPAPCGCGAQGRKVGETKTATLFLCVLSALVGGCSLKGLSLPLEDDFAGTCQWPEHEDEEALRDCADGTYRLRAKNDTPQMSWTGLSSESKTLRFEAVAAGTSTPVSDATFGIGCFDSKGEHGYGLAVARDDSFAILYMTSRLKDWRVLAEGQVKVRDGDNILRLDCVTSDSEATLDGFLNGQAIAVAKDPHPVSSFRALALFVGGETEGSFDDASARELSDEDSLAIAAQTATTVEPPAPPPPPPRVVYEEDFSRKSDLWPNDKSAGYSDGGFRLRVHGDTGVVITQNLTEAVTNLRIDVDARQPKRDTKQEHGLSCLLDGETGYSFAIQPDTRLWRISSYSTSSIDELTSGIDDPSIRRAPRQNHLRGVCAIGSDGRVSLTFFINGRKVAEAVDPAGPESFNSLSLDLTPGASGGEVLFDDLVARGS